MFNLENAWKKRKEIIQECKRKNACVREFTKLLQATNDNEFTNVLINNYKWVNQNLSIEIKYDYVYHFSEGFAIVKLNEKYGFIDSQGKVAIEIKYDDVNNFSEGFAKVKLNGKYGFIDSQGKVAIEIKYDDVNDFSEGFADVKLNGKRGKIDIKGNEYWG